MKNSYSLFTPFNTTTIKVIRLLAMQIYSFVCANKTETNSNALIKWKFFFISKGKRSQTSLQLYAKIYIFDNNNYMTTDNEKNINKYILQ